METEDVDSARATAFELVERLATATTHIEITREAIAAIAEEHPTVVEDLMPRLEEIVLNGASEPNKTYHQACVLLAFDLARIDHSAYALCEDLIILAADVIFDESEVEHLLVESGRTNPRFALNNLDLLMESRYNPSMRPSRGWALARAYYHEPDVLETVVARMQSTLAHDPESRPSAAERLGKVGIVAPDAAASAVPGIVTFAQSGNEGTRQAAIKALGQIVGRERRGDEQFGRPLADAPSKVFETLTLALGSADPEEVKVAAEAYVDAVADEPSRRSRAVSTLFFALGATELRAGSDDGPDADDEFTLNELFSSAEDEDAPVAPSLVKALDRITQGTQIDIDGATPVLVDAIARVDEPELKATCLRLLGRVEVTEENHDVIVGELSDALQTSNKTIREAAVDGVCAHLQQPDTDSLSLVVGLTDVVTLEEAASEEAIKGLAAVDTSPLVVKTLCDAVEDPDLVETAVETACEIGAQSVVDAVMIRLIDGFDAASPDDDLDTPKESSHPEGLNSLVYATKTVGDERPELLIPWASEIVELVVDTDSPEHWTLAETVAAIADQDPKPITLAADRLTERLSDTGPVVTGHLVAALLKADELSDRELRRVSSDHEARFFGPALSEITEQVPHLALELATELEADLRYSDDHIHVGRWIHEISEMGLSDVRLVPTALDLIEHALESSDSWVRTDGTQAAAQLAATHPEWVSTSRDALVKVLDDYDSDVVVGALHSLARSGAEYPESRVEPHTSHPHADVREAARTALAATDGPTGAEPDDTAGVPENQVDRQVFGVEPDSVDSQDLDKEKSRTERLATAVIGLRHLDERVRNRAKTVIFGLESDATTLEDALVSIAESTDPVERVLAVSVLGTATVERSDDHRQVGDTLVKKLDDPQPMVRRRAARSLRQLDLDRLNTESIGHSLMAHLRDTDPMTQAYLLRTLQDYADFDPDVLRLNLDAIVDCIDHPKDEVNYEAVAAVERAPPDAIVAVEGVMERVVDSLNDGRPSRQRLTTLVWAVAESDPAALRPHLDTLTDEIGDPLIHRALALLAARDASALAEYEGEFADTSTDTHVRYVLAQVRSPAYVDHLETVVAADPGTVSDELDVAVEFTVSVPRREVRRAAVESLVEACGTDRAVGEDLLTTLVETLATAADRTARQHAARALATAMTELSSPPVDGVVTETVLPALLDHAGADHWEIRSQSLLALEALVKTGWVEVDDYGRLVDVLVAALGDEHGRARRHAAGTIGALPDRVYHDHRLWERIRDLVKNGNTDEKRGGTLALGYVAAATYQLTEALDALAGQFATDDPWIRRNTLESTTRMLDGRAQIQIERVLESPTYPVRKLVREATSDLNPAVRAEACRCLGVVGTEADEEILIEKTEDTNTRVREAATEALQNSS